MTILCGIRVRVSEQGGMRSFEVIPEQLERKPRPGEQVLLAIHYYSHVLARYPRENIELDRWGMALRQMISDIAEQGVWLGSDLLRYAGLAESVRLARSDEKIEGKEVQAVLFRTLLGSDLDLALKLGAGIGEEALVQSVVALLQFIVQTLPEPEIELLDRGLRYMRTYVGEGANYANPAAAQNLANRAFREAGGDAA
jgi:hypothetical protein